jgi:hypothetical protein
MTIPPLSAEELYMRYLERHPGHISDLIFVLESKREREKEDQNIRRANKIRATFESDSNNGKILPILDELPTVRPPLHSSNPWG